MGVNGPNAFKSPTFNEINSPSFWRQRFQTAPLLFTLLPPSLPIINAAASPLHTPKPFSNKAPKISPFPSDSSADSAAKKSSMSRTSLDNTQHLKSLTSSSVFCGFFLPDFFSPFTVPHIPLSSLWSSVCVRRVLCLLRLWSGGGGGAPLPPPSGIDC